MFFKGYANDLSFVKFKQVSAAVVFALILLYRECGHISPIGSKYWFSLVPSTFVNLYFSIIHLLYK